jgi:hypothetical protein
MISAAGPPPAPAPAPRPPRPGTVRAAVFVQLGVAVLLVVAMLAVVVAAVQYNDLITQAARNISADRDIVDEERFGSIFVAVVLGGACLAIALWFGSLTIGLWRGANVARVLTAVGAGVPLLCGLCQAGSGAFIGAMVFSLPQGPPVDESDSGFFEDPEFAGYDEFYAELDRLGADFNWATVLAPVLTMLILMAVFAMVLLLFMPSANRYFRPQGPPRTVHYVPVPYPVYLPPPMPPWSPPWTPPPWTPPPWTPPPGPPTTGVYPEPPPPPPPPRPEG